MAEIIDYPDNRLKATRRSVLAGAVGTTTAPPTGGKVFGRRTAPFPQDPIIALIAEEDRWRSMAMLTREKAEKAIASLPERPQPQDFNSHPMMAETLEFEDAAGEILDRIRDTPADTLAGILAKVEYPIDVIRDSGVADLRRWLEARS